MNVSCGLFLSDLLDGTRAMCVYVLGCVSVCLCVPDKCGEKVLKTTIRYWKCMSDLFFGSCFPMPPHTNAHIWAGEFEVNVYTIVLKTFTNVWWQQIKHTAYFALYSKQLPIHCWKMEKEQQRMICSAHDNKEYNDYESERIR